MFNIFRGFGRISTTSQHAGEVFEWSFLGEEYIFHIARFKTEADAKVYMKREGIRGIITHTDEQHKYIKLAENAYEKACVHEVQTNFWLQAKEYEKHAQLVATEETERAYFEAEGQGNKDFRESRFDF
jgi:hypothetical protein